MSITLQTDPCSRETNVRPSKKARLDAMIEEATVDCYNEHEQATGLFTRIEDRVAVPFRTSILGVRATVERFDIKATGQSHLCPRPPTTVDLTRGSAFAHS